ncbi:uncharacterized protein BYT42DRAFT_586339 [Radiomyces spectabilis]|uniref:uncharacterized protein n=1 Tax=Radiomyces spectabilis TaxID=64574 RepID=UPI00221F9DD0|nr:uncharacterized protein BYT42DRAFT_586339 [Radiomyces spectabilis]KAI8367465.1 hypothetical protein BYT42DRAFT_586339 [Radiomyces spectabilis]
MHLYVKHAALINSCYPEKEGEKGPRSSELSYLNFYASSRPVKLTKVGSFLEKKVERDIAKNRKQNNHVSLHIVKSLIQSCHRDLNLFSKYVVRILNMMLDTRDIDLIDLTCDIFVVFGSYHDGSNLGMDAEFTADFETLLKKFAGFCDEKDGRVGIQMQYTGHRALQAAVTSSALQASNFKVQLNTILPSLMVTLAASKKMSNLLAQSKEHVDIRASALDNESVDEHTVDLLAAQTMTILFNKLNGAAVRLALAPLFSFLDAKDKWWPPNFAVSVMELVLESLQPQYRYLLVSEILQQVDNANSVHHTYLTPKHASLVSILNTILNANIPLVGISVLEVLNSLFTHLIKSLQHCDFRETCDSSDTLTATYEYAIHQGLTHSIGGLATQTYYQNQPNDISGYIIAKLRAGTTLKDVDGLPIAEYRRVALKCLGLLAQPRKETNIEENTDETHTAQGTISLEAWVPALGLLLDNHPETRIEFAVILTNYLESTTEAESAMEPFPKHHLNQHGDILFVNSLHTVIVQWIQLADLKVGDAKAVYELLCALTRRFGADGTIKSFPVIFKLQGLVKDGTINQTARQRTVAAITTEWMLMMAEHYAVDRLYRYIESLKEQRINGKEYSSLFLKDINTDNVGDFEQLEPDNTTPVDKFMDRHVVVEIISKDSPLRDEEDTHGLDLESKLYIEWGFEPLVHQERTFRIRTSRNLDDLKPKLATPWTGTDFKHTQQHKKQTINVENLKEALSIQPLMNDVEEPEADSLEILKKNDSLEKSNKGTRADMSTLLSSLNLGSSSESASSLVNPPYKS